MFRTVWLEDKQVEQEDDEAGQVDGKTVLVVDRTVLADGKREAELVHTVACVVCMMAGMIDLGPGEPADDLRDDVDWEAHKKKTNAGSHHVVFEGMYRQPHHWTAFLPLHSLRSEPRRMDHFLTTKGLHPLFLPILLPREKIRLRSLHLCSKVKKQTV